VQSWPDERHAGFRRVGCDRCAAEVLVVKFSQQHTSVQWNAASVRACAEFSARVAAGEQSALIGTCGSLRAAIDRAVSQGRLEVSPP
jgi:ABC-type glutathione transport system ATPase component